jgi:8-oxo-dGTP diphosphatase
MTPRNPALAVDCIVFDSAGRLLLIRRKNPPFQGHYALPGGYVDYGESTEHAAGRELAEETGLVATSVSLVGVYSDPRRDPRGHVVSIAYRVTTAGHDPRAGDDAAAAEFVAGWEDLALAFDHRRIVADALRQPRVVDEASTFYGGRRGAASMPGAKPASRRQRQPGRSA